LRSFFNRPRLLLTLASLFWAGNVVLGRGVAGAIPPVTLACLRWTLAALIFLPFALPHLREDAREIGKHWRILLFLGLIGPACYNSLSYLGLVSTEALNGLTLNAASPMFIALAAWGLFGDRLGVAQLLGMAAGFAGVLIVISKVDLASLASLKFNPGDLFLLTGMLFWSGYTACLRKRPRISWQAYNWVTYAIAGLLNVPFSLAELALGYQLHADLTLAASIFYVAIFPSLIAYIFYNRAVELLGPAPAGLYLFLIPVFGATLAAVFLGEKLHLFHALGFALIVGGVLIGSGRAAGPRLPASTPPRECRETCAER
jgi:drug/metabolite transporter (DMT)-like permease